MEKIDFDKNTITINGEEFDLLDNHFPTVNSKHPYRLTKEEKLVIEHLTQLFLHNEMLQKHARYLMQNGSMYLKYNNNLLFHAAVPLTENRQFMRQKVDGLIYYGKNLFDIYEQKIRHAYLNRYEKNNIDTDYFFMLWQGSTSPLFGKNMMRTFERYFIKSKKAHDEIVNPYYLYREEEQVLKMIYDEFELDFKKSKIVKKTPSGLQPLPLFS